jgi:hypothetical protein
MKRLILRIVRGKEYDAISRILSDNKYIVINTNLEEGTFEEINNNLSYEELFLIYRKLRKKYFKLREK